MELVVLALAAAPDPRLTLIFFILLVRRSPTPELFSSRTPLPSEFGRCLRRGRLPLWREMELLVLAGTADSRLPLSLVTLAQLMWRLTVPEISSSRTPVTIEFERSLHPPRLQAFRVLAVSGRW